MKNANFVTLVRSLKQVASKIERYHITISVVLVLGVFIILVLNVNTILSQPPDEKYRQETEQKSIQTNFDKATIDSINQLRERRDASSLDLPPGRNNPFAE